MRYFLHLAYQGDNYSGWQRQSTATSIQQVIEDSISKMLDEQIFIHGCGRTDAGVHATQYFAHIDILRDIDFDFVERINFMLPSDIAIYELIPVEKSSHAQYDVQFRTYTYYFHLQKIPAMSRVSAYYNVDNLDINEVRKALQIIKTANDFRSLCKNPDLYKHTRCKIEQLELTELSEKGCFKLTIKADRFLRGMIRYIIARLIDIGTHRLTLDLFATTLSKRAEFDYRFQKQGYPQGLYLSKVDYPYLTRVVNYSR
jgi:tRNA pseudouridine38-40 synthase